MVSVFLWWCIGWSAERVGRKARSMIGGSQPEDVLVAAEGDPDRGVERPIRCYLPLATVR
jgi:hypothetical protein